MSIRARLTIWYSFFLMLGFGLIAGWAYYEMAVAHPTVSAALRASGHTPLEELGEVLLFGGLPALLLAWIGGFFLMRHALAPVTRLTEAIERIQAENLRQQLPARADGDELDRLTQVFNEMTRRLDDSFQRIREFTLHASHELKTPLTVIRHELDEALQNKSLAVAERERFANLLDEIERLTQIVDGLNFITKADAGLLTLEKIPVRLDEIVRDAFDDAHVFAQPQRIELVLEACEDVTVTGDRRRLRQLLLILTENAVKYNWAGGRIIVSLCSQGKSGVITISNTGPGIPKEIVGRVFDRFFRGDASHNHDIEGCGLGLAIAQSIVRAHAGEIRFTSEVKKLTTVTVTLPLASSTLRATAPQEAVAA
jgi:signal transduction histidine kinase